MISDSNRNEQFKNPAKQPDFTLFYDASCPICIKEVNFLKRFNKQHKLVFQDINATDFKPEAIQLSRAQLMAEIHGQKASGELLKGMAVFRELYTTLGLGWLIGPTAWPILKPLFDFLYRIFAKNRSTVARFFFNDIPCDRCIK